MIKLNAVHKQKHETDEEFDQKLFDISMRNYKEVITPDKQTPKEHFKSFCEWEESDEYGADIITQYNTCDSSEEVFDERFDSFCRIKRSIFNTIGAEIIQRCKRRVVDEKKEDLNVWYKRVENILKDEYEYINDPVRSEDWYGEQADEEAERLRNTAMLLSDIQAQINLEPLRETLKSEEAKAEATAAGKAKLAEKIEEKQKEKDQAEKKDAHDKYLYEAFTIMVIIALSLIWLGILPFGKFFSTMTFIIFAIIVGFMYYSTEWYDNVNNNVIYRGFMKIFFEAGKLSGAIFKETNNVTYRKDKEE